MNVSHYIIIKILGDWGEMGSKLADNLVQMFGLWGKCPPYRADPKGIIGQHFRTININALLFLSGKVFLDIRECEEHHYRLDAELDHQ